MEKEQMKEAALDNVTTNEKLRKIFEIQFEDFYNETYGGQDE
jgi:predicted nucleic-acid-binding Zn-ribbon protein